MAVMFLLETDVVFIPELLNVTILSNPLEPLSHTWMWYSIRETGLALKAHFFQCVWLL